MTIYITNIGFLCCSTTLYNTNIGVLCCSNAILFTNNGLIICSTATYYTNIGVMCCSAILLDSGIRSEMNRTVGHTHATAMPCNRLYAKASCFRMMKTERSYGHGRPQSHRHPPCSNAPLQASHEVKPAGMLSSQMFLVNISLVLQSQQRGLHAGNNAIMGSAASAMRR